MSVDKPTGWAYLRTFDGARRVLFSLVLVFYLVFFVFIMDGWQFLGDAFVAWFGIELGGEFAVDHRIHNLVGGAIFWPVVIGVLAQFRSPTRNVAGQVMTLIPFSALLLAFALTGFWEPLPLVVIFGGIILLATVLHPAGRGLVTSMNFGSVNRILVGLVVIALIPMLAFAATEVQLQTGEIGHEDHHHPGEDHGADIHEEHVERGHFALMVAFTFIVLGMGMLASLSQPGWWLSAWLTGIFAAHLGVASALFPETSSSAGVLWGIAAIVWGIGFIAAAELTQDQARPTLLGAKGLVGEGART